MSAIKRYMEENSTPVFVSVCLSDRTLGISGPEGGESHAWRTEVFRLNPEEADVYANLTTLRDSHRLAEESLEAAKARTSDSCAVDDDLVELEREVGDLAVRASVAEIHWLEVLQESVFP